MKQIHFSSLFKVSTKMTNSLHYTVVSYSQHARWWTHNSTSPDLRSSTNTALNVLPSASEYCIQPWLLPRKTTNPPATQTETSSFSCPSNLPLQCNPKYQRNQKYGRQGQDWIFVCAMWSYWNELNSSVR